MPRAAVRAQQTRSNGGFVPDLFGAYFDTKLLSPHGFCLLWRPQLLWTHVISDVVIGLAYFSIPLALGVLLHRRRDVRFGWAVWMFVAFILLCGVTHFMSIWTLWRPDYGVEALIKAATAVASLVTAMALWPLLPKVIAIPSVETLEARVKERDEALARLSATMKSMVAMEEHQAEQERLLLELQTAEAQLRSIVDNAAVGIARVALDGTFLQINDRLSQIVGWSRDEILAGGFQRITHPDDLETDLQKMSDLLQGRVTWYAVEKRYVRADGGLVWAKVTRSLVRTADGAANHLVTIVEDVTEEWRAREARELLMREVDHRARNALTVVQSMIRLTEAPNDEAFRTILIGRVDALARAQGSLARSNWSGALVGDVVAQELHALAAPETIQLDGPATLLEPHDVQPFSMIIHELATNAAKYGALSRPGGRLLVRWSNRAGGALHLLWTETGGPSAGLPSKQGFGTRLIERLGKQLKAETEFNWATPGLQFRLAMRGAEAVHAHEPASPCSTDSQSG